MLRPNGGARRDKDEAVTRTEAASLLADEISRVLAGRDDLVDAAALVEIANAMATGDEPWLPAEPALSLWKMSPGQCAKFRVRVLGEVGDSEIRHAAYELDARALHRDVGETRLRLEGGDPQITAALRDRLWRTRYAPGQESCGVLARSLDYLLACCGDRAAMARLSMHIGEFLKSGGPISDLRRTKAVRLAESWRRLAFCSMESSLDPMREAEREIRTGSFHLLAVVAWAGGRRINLPPAAEEAGCDEAPVEAPVHARSLTVLASVGDPESKEAVQIKSRYAALLKPMELRPGPGPDDIWRTMQREFPWLREANRKLAEAAALSSKGGIYRMRPLLLVGPRGVGKTRWARRAAEALGLPFGSMSLAGACSAVLVNGTERGWNAARAGYVPALLCDRGVANPLVLADEADKASESSHNGNALDAMLPLLERESAARHYDAFLMAQADLSAVNWVLTANSLACLPDVLLSRVDICHAGRPRACHFSGVIETVLADFRSDNGLPADEALDLGEAMPALERSFSETADVRSLKGAVRSAVVAGFWAPPGPRAA